MLANQTIEHATHFSHTVELHSTAGWVSSTALLPQFPHLFPFSPSYRLSSYECHFYWLYFLHFSSLKTKEFAFLLGKLWHRSESRSWLHLVSEQDCICSFSYPLPVPSPALLRSRSLWQPLCGRLPKSLTTRTLLGIRQRMTLLQRLHPGSSVQAQTQAKRELWHLAMKPGLPNKPRRGIQFQLHFLGKSRQQLTVNSS